LSFLLSLSCCFWSHTSLSLCKRALISLYVMTDWWFLKLSILSLNTLFYLSYLIRI
jgi:hypothetical protein